MRARLRDDRGATAVEYALIMMLVALTVVVSVTLLGARLSGSMTASGDAVGAVAQGVESTAPASDDEAAAAAAQAAEEAAKAAEEKAAADAKVAEEARAAEEKAAEEAAKAAEEAAAEMTDEERAKADEEAAKADEEADKEAEASGHGPKPTFVKGEWTCPGKWTYVKGECVK